MEYQLAFFKGHSFDRFEVKDRMTAFYEYMHYTRAGWELFSATVAGCDYAPTLKATRKKKYKGSVFYLCDGQIYDAEYNVLIENASNGFLDLFEYYEYFEPNTRKEA